MNILVLDTCVIVDMFITTRPRHSIASRLHREMVDSGSVAKVPAFAMFEISHAFKQEKRLNDAKLMAKNHSNAGEESGLTLELVPIDQDFIQQYFSLELPELRAGDMVFAALAKGQSLPLVTEDQPLIKKVSECGIQAFTTSEYLYHAFGIKAK